MKRVIVLLLCLTACKALRIRANQLIRGGSSQFGVGDRLYQDQQAAKKRRAEFEETLLLPGRELPEEVFQVPTSSGSGFGAATSGKAKAAQLAEALRFKGVIRLNGCLQRETARALRLLILDEMERAREAISIGEMDAFSVLGMEPERKSRTDFKVSLTRREKNAEGKTDFNHPVADALNELFGENGVLRGLYDVIAGDNGFMYDLGCMTTQPGSPRQTIHTDFPWQPQPPIYSVYVALQDVTAEMGPTVFFPRTNNPTDYGEWKKPVTFDDYLRGKTPKFALLKKGDLIVYDPLVLHCGAANILETGAVRSLFNVGFRNPKVQGDFGYGGSMRPGYQGQMTFGQLKKCLAKYKKGSAVDPFAKFGNGLF